MDQQTRALPSTLQAVLEAEQQRYVRLLNALVDALREVDDLRAELARRPEIPADQR